MATLTKLSDYLVRFIADQGVKHVFMLPGGGAMHLNDSLGRCPDIEFVCNLHEQACSIAADAYARVTNNLGVAMVTTGPGGTNAVTGAAAAWLDSTPCIFVSGQVKRDDLKTGKGIRQLGNQEIDIVTIVQSITKYAVTVMDPTTIRYHLEKALALAKSGRPGPVWLDIPLDVQAAMIDPEQLPGFDARELCPPPDTGTTLPAQVSELFRLLNQAERPVLLVGNGIHVAHAEDAFRQLAERLGVPVLATWMAIDLLSNDHLLFAGCPGVIAPRYANFALQNSDFLLVLGSRLDMGITAYSHERFARAAKKAIVDIDPSEIQKIRTKIDVPICADLAAFLREALRQVGTLESKDRSPWLERCRQWKAKYPLVLPEHWAQQEGVSTYCLSDVLSDQLTGDDLIVPGSSGNGVELFFLAFRAKSGQRIIHSRGLGAMGFGLPASIAACIASGGRRTVCVDGDGGFQLNIQELATAARLNLPVKFFVVSNRGFASIRASQQTYFGRLTAADSTSGVVLPDVLKIANAYGVATTRATSHADLRQVVAETLAMPGPVVCEVVAVADEVRSPRVVSVQKSDGSMVSKPLEDLWPFLDRDEFRANMLIPPIEE